MQYYITSYVCIVYYMKCRLVQILAVAIVLGHTVLLEILTPEEIERQLDLLFEIDKPNAWDTLRLAESTVNTNEPTVSGITRLAESTAKANEPTVSGISRLAESTVNTNEPTVSGISRLAESTLTLESSETEANTLLSKINNIIGKLSIYDFTKFDDTNKEQVYDMVDELFSIKKRIKDSTHKDRDMLLEKVNTEINAFIKNSKVTFKNARKQVRNMHNKLQEIKNIIAAIDKPQLSYKDIQLIHDRCKNVGIYLPDINKYAQLKQIRQKLVEVQKKIQKEIISDGKTQYQIAELFTHIKKKPIEMRNDIRDTQSMRNVIGISIAVCAIVTLCIVLLIAVRNKHRTNAGVRLVNWV